MKPKQILEMIIMAAVIIAVLIGLMLLFSNPAAAREVGHDECYSMAQDIYIAAHARDKVKSKTELIFLYQAALDKQVGDEKTYVETKQQADDLMREIVRVIYSTESPKAAAANAYNSCMRTKSFAIEVPTV